MKEIIRIGTYNTGDFSGENIPAGSEQARIAFCDVIESDSVDFWALQEDVEFFDPEAQELPYTAVYGSYKNYRRCGNKKYNYKAFLTNLPLGDTEQIYYTGEEKFDHAWFLHTQLRIEDKDVCMICLHFDWADRDRRKEQIRQVISFASRYEYSMIIGDFNPDDFVKAVRQSENIVYEQDLRLFREAGFQIANADKFGIFTTIPTSKQEYPCDNIVVSPNIKIHNVGRIYRVWMNDHAALWADVELR